MTSKTYEWDPDQVRVLQDRCNHGILLIESVPGSGKTQLLLELSLANHNQKTLFISYSNAVRNEVTARLRNICHQNEWLYETEYTDKGNHNTIKVSTTGALVHIATLDSWVHAALLELASKLTEPSEIEQINEAVESTDYRYRRECLIGLGFAAGIVFAETLMQYNQIAIDEIQDFDNEFCTIMLHIAKLCEPGRARRLVLAGDRYQNVFARADFCVVARIKEQLAISSVCFREYLLQYNHRCPPAHLRFVNEAMRPVNQGRDILWLHDKPDGEKPIMIRANGGASDRAAAVYAEEIVNLVDECIADGFRLEDIRILSPRTRSNKVFAQLEQLLREAYDSRGHVQHSRVAWMRSMQYGGDTSSMDWDWADQKLTMASIHSNKGRTHKVVIAIDFTDGVLPRGFAERAIDIESQSSQCLVALTRATDRLYVVYSDPITRFFGPNIERLRPYCTLRTTTAAALWHDRWQPPLQGEPLTYNPKTPTKDITISPKTFPTTMKAFVSTLFELNERAVVRLIRNTLSLLSDALVETKRFAEADMECTDDAAAEKNMATVRRENLGTVIGYYGQCYLYHHVLRLPLAPKIAAYGNAITTKHRNVEYFFRRIMGRWADYVAKNPGRPYAEYPLAQSIIDDPRLADTLNENRMQIETVVKVIQKKAPHTPTDTVVLLRSPYDGSGAPIKELDRQVVASVLRYQRTKDISQLWNIALVSAEVCNGAMKRDWLTTLFDNPASVVNLHESPITDICRNCNILGGLLQSKLAAIEVPVCLDLTHNAKLVSIEGRADLILTDGSIVDIKCPLAKNCDPTTGVPKVSFKEFCQLLLYAAARPNTTAIQIVNVTAGFTHSLTFKDPSVAHEIIRTTFINELVLLLRDAVI